MGHWGQLTDALRSVGRSFEMHHSLLSTYGSALAGGESVVRIMRCKRGPNCVICRRGVKRRLISRNVLDQFHRPTRQLTRRPRASSARMRPVDWVRPSNRRPGDAASLGEYQQLIGLRTSVFHQNRDQVNVGSGQRVRATRAASAARTAWSTEPVSTASAQTACSNDRAQSGERCGRAFEYLRLAQTVQRHGAHRQRHLLPSE